MKVLVACEESQAVTKELRRLGHEAYSCDIIECSGGHPEWHIQGDVLKILNPSCIQVLMGSTPTPYTSENDHLVVMRKEITFQTMDGKWHTIDGRWDMIIAFPPCTHLANSGARHFEKKRINGKQARAIRFFASILAAECERIAVENPVGIISGQYILDYFPELCEEMGLPQKPDQIIQPWQFALSDAEKTEKTTCLWIKGLRKLKPLHTEKPEIPYKEWFDKKTGRTKRQTLWYYNTRCLGTKERAVAASKTFPGIARAMAEQWGGEVCATKK